MTEGLHEIPNGWSWTSLGEICEPTLHIDPTRKPKKAFRYVDISSISNETFTITGPKTYVGADAPSRARKLVRTHDVLISTVRTYLRNIAMVPPELDGEICSTGLCVLRPINGIADPRFVFRYVLTNEFIDKLSREQRGISYPAVTDTYVYAQPIPLPPFREQKRIVERIERLIKQAENSRRSLRYASSLMAQFRQSVLAKALRGNATHGHDQQEGDRRVPKEWSLVTLRDVISDVQTGFACGKRADDGYVQLRMNNIGLEGSVILDKLLKVPKPETNLQKYALRSGDVLFNNTNSPGLIGKTVLFQGEISDCVFSNHITRIRVNESVTIPEWTTWLLVREQQLGTFERMCHRFVGQAGISRRDLLSLPYPLPPLSEQERMVAIIRKAFSYASQIKKSVELAGKKTSSIEQSVYVKAFRGQLVRQDPGDEPTSTLLERVKNQRGRKSKHERTQTVLEAEYPATISRKAQRS